MNNIKEKKLDSNKTIYASINHNDKTNGFLAIDSTTRNVYLRLYKTEKYNGNSLELIPGTLTAVQVSQDIYNVSKEQTIVKIILDANYRVLYSECIGESSEIIESLLTKHTTDKISGIYPGKFKEYQKVITNLSEANIYLLINKAKQILENINFSNYNIIKEEKIEWEYALDFCLAHLTRFGIEQHYNPTINRMEETPTFKAWYKWWKDYFEEIMNDPELSCLLYDQQKHCQNLDMFHPEGSFYEYLTKNQNPKQKVKVPNKPFNIQEKVS